MRPRKRVLSHAPLTRTSPHERLAFRTRCAFATSSAALIRVRSSGPRAGRRSSTIHPPCLDHNLALYIQYSTYTYCIVQFSDVRIKYSSGSLSYLTWKRFGLLVRSEASPSPGPLQLWMPGKENACGLIHLSKKPIFSRKKII